jgi:hypothetical protein
MNKTCPLDRVLLNKINYDLKRTYGSDKLNGRQMFRLVWADDEFEYRRMTLPDGSIALEDTYLHKYPWSNCYLFEKSTDYIVNNSEIKTHNGYECVYRLPDDKPLNQRAVQMLAHWSVTGTIARGKNISEYTDEKEKEERLKELEKEQTFFYDYLTQQGGDLGFSEGRSVLNVGTGDNSNA